MQTKEDFFMEVKKAKWLKFISAIAIFAVMIFCTGLNVHAEDVKDGILVTVSSDKENYNSEDEVNLKITVKNTNDFEVSDIKVENILPDGISLVSGEISKDNINLQANEETVMNLTVKKADSGQADIIDNTTSNVSAVGKSDTSSSNGKIPNTGESDTPLIALIVMIISIAIMVICFWKGRKKHLKFLSLFVCLGVVGTFGITGITHAVSDNAQTETINSSDENISSFTTEFTYMIDNVKYAHNITITYYNIDIYIFNTVDKELQETIVTDTFRNANLEERKEIALNLLNRLESENRIKKGSIKFNEEYNSYFFEYLNGGEGSIILEDFSSTNELAPVGNASNRINRSYVSSNNDNAPSNPSNLKYTLNNSANEYIKENLSKDNLIYSPKKALIIDDWSVQFNQFRTAYESHKEVWSSNDLKTDIKQNVTVEDFKTILNGYDFIDINIHGYIDGNGNPTMCLQEKQPFIEDDKYCQDRKEKRVGTLYGGFGGNFYLKPSFFSYYYSDKLTYTIVWVSSCKGYINDNLVSVFANECGAKAVIAPTDTVYIEYDVNMTDIFVHKLLFGYTVDEALKEAKLQFGKNDEEWHKKRYNISDNTPAEFKNYNGGNETLVELVPVEVEEYGTLSGTVIDESGNPVKNAEVLAIPNRGNTCKAITDDNGQFIINDCPVDSYRIEVSAEEYELYQSDEFLSTDYVVLEGQAPKSVTIQLKKLKEYTEDDLKEKVISESNGNIVAWVYEDFDGNGTKEAFAVIDNGAEDVPKIQSIYFIDNKGNTKEMRNTFDYPAYDDSKYTICQGKGFFSVDVSGGGSAWKTYLFSVKDNNAYELDISGDLQGFYERNGIFYTTENNFNNGTHEYPEIELIYNSDTQQFTKGQHDFSINGTELSRYTFSIDGAEFTAILFEEEWDGISADLNYLLTVFRGSSETNLSSIIVNYKHNTGTDSSSTNVLDYIEVFNNNLGIIEYKNSDMKIVSNYLWDSANNQFVYNGGNQIGGY